MNAFHRLHLLRMENDAARYEMAEMRPRFERLANRHENGTAPHVVTAPGLFQTPAQLAARMAAALRLAPGAAVLEPSAGLGRLLDAVAPYAPGAVVAVEMAAACAGELYRQERPGTRILQRDFLTIDPAELGEFDAAIMNPPFHRGTDIDHIRHAIKFLRPGGTLAALCLSSCSRADALRDRADTWEEIPAGAFRAAGTNVATAFLTLTR